ncbi:MAG: hypothetical protein LQ339_006771 [Xanthoria mediterranea]|nr:MAG: hypothetical protein LQ339_006771 [Xanthoria mediterranea]
MSSAGPSTDLSTLTAKQLADSVKAAQDEYELVRQTLFTKKYAKGQRQLDEYREEGLDDYERSAEPFLTPIFSREESKKKMAELVAKHRTRMAKENEMKALASAVKKTEGTAE